MTELCNQKFSFFQFTLPPIKFQTLHGANTRTGRCHVLWLVYNVPSKRFGDRRHLLPTWRPIQEYSSVMKPLMVLICNNNACALKLYPLIEHGSHGRIVKSYQTSLRAGN